MVDKGAESYFVHKSMDTYNLIGHMEMMKYIMQSNKV